MTVDGAWFVDVVIPYYGDLDYLGVAIHSVLTQTDQRLRLTVIQDGPEVADAHELVSALDDPRIRLLRNEANLGLAGNFQRCLDVSTSQWVTFLGSDDVLLPQYVATVCHVTDQFPEVAVIQPGVSVIDRAGKTGHPLADHVKRLLSPRVQGTVRLHGESLVASLMRGNWTYFPSLCWRREAIARIGFRTDLPTTLDLALLVQVVMNGGPMVVTDEIVFHYRRHSDSVSSSRAADGSRFDEERRLFTELADSCARRGWNRAARSARWRLSSRAHAMSLLPRTLLIGDLRASARLVGHVLDV